ncbi:hypothetical protein DIPPA_33076 [Diplonema papillatum]|nr:hypothetical protein DIPPA_33076 [Diplonema papillatum]
MALLAVDGHAVNDCDDVRAIASGKPELTLKFARKSPFRLLACAGCEREAVGFAKEDKTSFWVAQQLVHHGDAGVQPTVVLSSDSPEAQSMVQGLMA